MERRKTEITRKARKEAEKLDRPAQSRVLDAIDALQREPWPHGVKAPKESLYYRRIRAGDYRVICAYCDGDWPKCSRKQRLK